MSRARERYRRYYLALVQEEPSDWQRIEGDRAVVIDTLNSYGML